MTDEQYIKSLPLTTNKIEVTIDKEAFFSKYAIVSYYGTTKESKNLAYEQFADKPCLSVTGIRARWANLKYPETRFFILRAKLGCPHCQRNSFFLDVYRKNFYLYYISDLQHL